MAEEGKKISFGFAKSIKKPVLKTTVPQEEKKIDYIECLDEKAIKVIGEEEKKDEPLVIPLLGSKTWHDRIVNKIDADIFEPKAEKEKDKPSIKVKEEPNESVEVPNGNASPQNGNSHPVEIKTEPPDNDENTVNTLDEQAAKEIIEDLKSIDNKQKETNNLSLPLSENETLLGREESTIEDYEKIPVDAFGLAMLRGMGWQPGKGIGKNEKVVAAAIPELRPKGMGLGADKVTIQKANSNVKSKQEEDLKIEKGTYVKIIAGKQSNNYGQIEGFDDDAGRFIVKMALGGSIISVNEFMVQPVTKSEYSKNSKVLNVAKYEKYKNKKERTSSESASDNERKDRMDKERKKNTVEQERSKLAKTEEKKRSTARDKRSSSSDNESERKARKRKSSSSSDTYKPKRSKKSKKHKKQDYSPERSSKKHKKKNKEREIKDKRSRRSASLDRRKHKKHKRSRSRSHNRR